MATDISLKDQSVVVQGHDVRVERQRASSDR